MIIDDVINNLIIIYYYWYTLLIRNLGENGAAGDISNSEIRFMCMSTRRQVERTVSH